LYRPPSITTKGRHFHVASHRHRLSPTSPEYGKTVQKAMRFITLRMLEGQTTPQAGLVRPEVNGIVAVALSEAYLATRIPFLKPAMEKGLSYIVKGQLDSGGFGRRYGDSEDRWDLVVTGWQVEALAAGHRAGASVPGLAGAARKSTEFLKGQCMEVYADKKRGYFQLKPNGQATAATQSVGTWALQALGEVHSREARAGVRFLSRNRKEILLNVASHHPGAIPFYTWYCTSRVMWHGGATAWRRWRRVYPKHIAGLQLPDGHWGAPVSEDDRSEFEPYYSTALACLSLQVHRRDLAAAKIAELTVPNSDTSILDVDDVGLDFRLQPPSQTSARPGTPR